MLKRFLLLSIVVFAALFGGLSVKPNAASSPNAVAVLTPISLYGAWHCGNEFCSWASV